MSKVRAWGKACRDLATKWITSPITKAPFVAIPLEEWINIQNTLAEFESSRIRTLRQHQSDSRNITVVVDRLKEILNSKDKKTFRERVIVIPKFGKTTRVFRWFFKPRATAIRVKEAIEVLEELVDQLDSIVEFGCVHVPKLADRLPIITQRSKA